MRKLDVLHLAAAAAFAISTSFAGVGSVQAAGLSDKQKDEISEFIKCQTYLLKADLASFEADPDCGKGPVVVEYLGAGGSGGHQEPSCSYDGPKQKKGGKKKNRGGYEFQSFSQGGYEGGYCHEDKKPDHKKKGKKPGKKPGGFPGEGGFPGGGFGGFGGN